MHQIRKVQLRRKIGVVTRSGGSCRSPLIQVAARDNAGTDSILTGNCISEVVTLKVCCTTLAAWCDAVTLQNLNSFLQQSMPFDGL